MTFLHCIAVEQGLTFKNPYHTLHYLIVHDAGIGLGCGATLKWRPVVEKFVKDDPHRPPVTADTILGLPVQTLQHFWADVLWSPHGKIRLHLQKGVVPILANNLQPNCHVLK